MSVSSGNSRYNAYNREDDDEDDDGGTRTTWEILSWIVVVLTIVLNLVVIGVLLVRRNAYTVVNRAILTLGLVDLLYGVFVSPFFVENYIHLHWDQSQGYCHFFEYFFTFHDLFVPLVLVLLCTYISLSYSGATENFGFKRPLYIGCAIVGIILSFVLAIPATVNSAIFIDNPPNGQYKQECRSLDNYTMVLTYCLSSSLLFCFAMSFLFSLCIVGSPLLKNVPDREEYIQRWRLLLTISLVNGLYIVTGFLLNFKEMSRMVFKCCDFDEPYISIDTTTYDVFSFVLLLSEPFLRPLALLCFYFKYLLTDVSAY
jgi:hypothetical protein